MKRIYFLVPGIELARTIVNEMLIARIEARRIHVLAKRGTPLAELPEASMMQKSDFSSAVQRGLTIGGGVGVLGALAGLGLSQGAGAIAGGVILAAGLGGAAAGAWIGGMLGLSAGNSHLKTYEGAIERGELLLMLDVPRTRVDEITDLVKLRHPQAQSGGTDPFIPVFP